jgi:formylglycine-generating enzyme required for sulfatase activity
MGAVYRGRHLVLERDVAVKCLILPTGADEADGARLIRLFQREARIGADLTHENLVRLFELGEQHGLHYLVLEFVEGEDANAYVAKRGPLPELEAARIVWKVARGLAKAHQHPDVILHRDIKPANILISKRGEVKLGDLGLAKAIEQMSAASLLSGLGGVGTSAFMPPEQRLLTSQLTPAADIWALGVTLHFLLTARIPGIGADPYEWQKRLETSGFPDVRPFRPELSPEIARILERCTRFHPRDRIQDATALGRELQAYFRKRAGPVPLVPERTGPGLAPPVVSPEGSEVEGLERSAGADGVDARFATGPQPQVRPSDRAAVRSRRGIWIGAGLVTIAAVAAIWIPWGKPAAGKPPAGWNVIDSAPGWGGWAREVEHPVTGIRFLLVEPGRVRMGSPRAGRGGAQKVRAQEPVVMPYAYYLARTETTRLEFWRLDKREQQPDAALERLPVQDVTWASASAFCAAIGCELPSPEEWEYAARAGSETEYAWGDDPEEGATFCNGLDASKMNQIRDDPTQESLRDEGHRNAFAFEDGYPNWAPVAALEPNAWGFYDMQGNVAEWCRDDEPTGSAQRDPDRWRAHAARGGSYLSGTELTRLANRGNVSGIDYDAGFPDIGFRALRRLPG